MNRILVVLAFLPAADAVLAQRVLPEAPDAYGYTALAGPNALCAYQYIDLHLTGDALDLVAAGELPAGDEGGAELALAEPFEFYGEPVTQLVVSSNGYLAPGAALDAEDGGYWRSDCPLPAIPDNRRATFARIQALQDDLAAGSQGQLFAQHFTECPRAAASGLAQACTVVEWRAWTRYGHVGTLDFQVVLYHGSWEIALQYRTLGGMPAQWTPTIGIQDARAHSAWTGACGGSPAPAPASALCLFDPRFPPDASELIFRDGFEM